MLRHMETSDLTHAQWERRHPQLPPQQPRTGRPAKDHRTVINGILWVLRTGSPWRCLPERYGSWKTVSSRFYRWQRAGVWGRILAALQRRADADGWLDWTLHFVDSTVVRAHQHAAGAKGGTRWPRRWAGAGAVSARRSTSAPRGAKPMVLALTAGERHEQPVLPALMERGAVKRMGRGRPRIRPDRVVGDKGYSSPAARRYLKGRRIGAVIPTKADEAPDPSFDRAAYRERNVVERLINRLKQWRRVATRYEKRAVTYVAMVTIACILLWL